MKPLSRDAGSSAAEGLELASGSRLLVRFSVTAALRHLFALARRFRFEGFGIGAAIHANPDLLSNVRALVIVCAVHPHFVLSGDAHAARNSLSYRYFLRTPPLCSTFVMRHRSQGVNKGTVDVDSQFRVDFKLGSVTPYAHNTHHPDLARVVPASQTHDRLAGPAIK
jgi:hypothetical protein